MKKRKWEAIILCLALTAGMVGCGNADSGGTQAAGDTDFGGNISQTEEEKTKETGDIDAESGTTDIWAPYANTVTIHTVTNEGDPNAYPEGDDITSNAWTREYMERFNIELVTDWTINENDYTTKLNLAIAEGDLPDVFRVNASQLRQLIEADMIMDLTEVFDSYASETIKSYMQMDLDSFESGHKEGKLYGIPQMGYGLITQPNYIWIRKDWREEQNLDGPETMDELVEMTKRFMENYGGYGIAAEQSMDYLNMLAVAWGAHPDAWIKGDDGSLVYGSIQPEMKDALEAWAQWYQEGLLSIDFAVMDVAKMNQDVIDGKTGIMPSYQWWGWDPGIEELKNNGQNSYFEPFMIPSATGEEVLHTAFFDTTTYTVVNKNCKNPEAALKLINLYSFIVDEDTNGEKDFEWLRAFNDKGMIHATGAFKVLNPNGDYESFERVVEAVNNNDTSILTSMDVTKYDQVKIFMETGDPDQLGGYLQMGPERSSYGLAKVILDNKQYVKSALQGIMPDTLLNAGSTLDDILTEGFTKIVIGDQPIDYFDTIVESWKKAGGDQATIEMNALYNS